MKTNKFITALRNSPDKQLQFVNESGDTVHSGYHLTEIKAANFDTVDCGSQVNHWHETILQLWVPADADDEYMSASKFLRIYDKVRGLVSVMINRKFVSNTAMKISFRAPTMLTPSRETRAPSAFYCDRPRAHARRKIELPAPMLPVAPLDRLPA